MTSDDKKNLTVGPVSKKLLGLTWPMTYGLLAIFMFYIVDTYFIAQLGVDALAAIGFTVPVVFALLSIGFGLSIGTTAIVAQAIGKGLHDKVKRLTSDAILLSVVIVIAASLIAIALVDPTFRMLGADDQTLDLIKQYMIPWYLGMFLVVVPMVGNAAMRAAGDAKTPSLILVYAGIVNIVLDPLLIFGWGPFPRWELFGAAIATLISYLVSAVWVLYLLKYRDNMYQFTLSKWDDFKDSARRILFLGVPAAGTQVMHPIATGIITAIMAQFGNEAVAAMGVGLRIESIAIVGIIAMQTAILPFIAQNYGSKKWDRLDEGIHFAFKFSVMWGVSVYAILALTAPWIALLFTSDPTVLAYVKLFIWIVPLTYGLYGFIWLLSSAYNGLSKPMKSAFVLVIYFFVLLVPGAYIGSQVAGVMGVFIGMSIAGALGGIMAYTVERRDKCFHAH